MSQEDGGGPGGWGPLAGVHGRMGPEGSWGPGPARERVSGRTATHRSVPPLQPSRVVLVEGEEAVGRVVVGVLDGAGFEVDVVSDLVGAAEALKRPCGLLLLDLPADRLGDAWVLMRQLASRGGGPPVVLISESNDPEDMLASFRLGGRDWLRKPIRPAELLHICRRLLRNGRPHPSMAGMGHVPRLPGASVIASTPAPVQELAAPIGEEGADGVQLRTIDDPGARPL